MAWRSYPAGFDDPAELAEVMGDQRYDALAAFLDELSEKLGLDGDADGEQGRVMIASALRRAAQSLAVARDDVAEAWRWSQQRTPPAESPGER